jgi:hypothetical protein
MVRRTCPGCKTTTESNEREGDVVYCRTCGLILHAPANVEQKAATQPQPAGKPVPAGPPAKVAAPTLSLAATAANAWFYVSKRQKVGPVSFEVLKNRVASGELLPTDMVLKSGTQKWSPASSLPALFPVCSAKEWFYIKARQKVGPVAMEELKRLLASGQLLAADMIFKTGMQKWVAATSIPELVPNPPANVQRPAGSKPGTASTAPATQAVQRTAGSKPGTAPTLPATQAVQRSAGSKPGTAPTAEVKEWHYAKNRQKVGPVSLGELKQLLASGTLLPSDMILRPGTARWLSAASIPEVSPAAASSPPPGTKPSSPPKSVAPAPPPSGAKPSSPPKSVAPAAPPMGAKPSSPPSPVPATKEPALSAQAPGRQILAKAAASSSGAPIKTQQPLQPAAADQVLSPDVAPVDEESAEEDADDSEEEDSEEREQRAPRTKNWLLIATVAYLVILLGKLLAMFVLHPDSILVFWPFEWLAGILLAWVGLRRRTKSSAVVGLSSPVVALTGLMLIDLLGLTKDEGLNLLQWVLVVHTVLVFLAVGLLAFFRERSGEPTDK